ncbi:MAG: hypothetical protein JWR27_282 [Aeromicrobium sp.]|nr:hypothetical protein [Aeromicrobium sp.]
MRSLPRHAAALTLLAGLALAGCGGNDSDGSSGDSGSGKDSTSAAPANDAEPSDGDTVKGKGYAFNAPKGWEVPKQDIPGTEQTDTFVADLTDADGFADNINVIRLDPAPIKDLDPLEKALIKELVGAGAKNVKAGDRLDVDGDAAVHISSKLTQQGASYLTEQYNPIHDGVSYVVTFSFSTDVSQSDRDKTAESVLASWNWAA